MPFIPDAQLAKLGNAVTSRDAMIQRLREQAKSKGTQDNAIALGTGFLGAGGFGFVRGKLEDPATGAWNVPGTQIDWELLAVAAVTGLALGGGMVSKDLKKFEAPATHVALAIGGHYVGQLARKFARTQKFSLVAGQLPPPGDGSRSISYHATQMGAPYADPVAEALSQSGV